MYSDNFLELVDVTGMSDWDKHFASMENMVSIYCHNKYYGMSDKLKNQIGTESLSDIMSNFCKYVKEFFAWLWRKIKEFYTKIKNFVLRIIARVRRFLFGDSIGSRSNVVTMCTMFKTFISKMEEPKRFYNIVGMLDLMQYIQKSIFPFYKEYKIQFGHIDQDKVETSISNNLELMIVKQKDFVSTQTKDPRTISYSITELLDVSETYDVFSNAFPVLDKTYEGVEKISNDVESMNLNENNVLDKLDETCSKITNECCNTIQITYDHLNKDEDKVSIHKKFLKELNIVLKIVNDISSFGAKSLDIYSSFLTKIYDLCNIKGTAIEFDLQLPEDFKQHIEYIIGGEVQVDHVFVTNKRPTFWDLFGEEAGGKTVFTTVNPNSYKNVTVFINANGLIDDESNRDNASQYAKFINTNNSSIVERFLSAIVHEVNHCYDSQRGIDLFEDSDIPEKGDYKRWGGASYLSRTTEVNSRNAERKYIPTASEIAWAKSLFDKINEQIKKAKVTVMDIEPYLAKGN